VPKGRESWQDAMNQVKGNIRWMLEFLSSEELIEEIARIEFKEYTSKQTSISSTYKNLEAHSYYHAQMSNFCSQRLSKIDECISEQDLPRDQQMEAVILE
jgi:hypothetical protein